MPKRCYFLELPLEIRDMIYELSLRSDVWIGLSSQVSFTTKRLLPGHGLLVANRQINIEAQRVVGLNDVLLASHSRNFELLNMELRVPRLLMPHVKRLTIQLSAPEIAMQERMEEVKDALLGAPKLKQLTIQLFPFNADPRARCILTGIKGQHTLRKGFNVLKKVQIRGDVSIQLIGCHMFCTTGRYAKKNRITCEAIVKDIADDMMVESEI